MQRGAAHQRANQQMVSHRKHAQTIKKKGAGGTHKDKHILRKRQDEEESGRKMEKEEERKTEEGTTNEQR